MPTQPPESTPVQAKGLRRFIGPKRLVLLAFYCVLGAAMWYYWRTGVLSPEHVLGYIARNPVAAPFVFIVFYALVVLFMVPSLPLNLGAGYLWGPLLGSVYTLIGCTLGSVLAFLFARTALGQPLARRFDNNILQWLAVQIATKGWQVVAFIRINPAFPSGPANYLLGLTSISFASFFWATLVFLYPLCLAFAFVGKTAGGLILEGDAKSLAQFIIAAALTVCVLIAGRVAYKHFFQRAA